MPRIDNSKNLFLDEKKACILFVSVTPTIVMIFMEIFHTTVHLHFTGSTGRK